MHSKIGNTEWSGELITREEGTINDLDNWKIYCEDIYLADIGSPGFTGYEVDKGAWKSSDIIDMYSAFPGLAEGTHKAQHIHSHHNMSTFFSGTDWSQLNDRSMEANYFLMLIVNHSGPYVAKVAFRAQVDGAKATTYKFANNADGYEPLTLAKKPKEEALVVMDCEILTETEPIVVTKEFMERYESVKKAIEEEEAKKKTFPQAAKQVQIWSDDYSGSYEDYKKKQNIREKKISEMTDKEFNEYQGSGEKERFKLMHARVLTNAIIDQKIEKDYSCPIDKLKKMDKKMGKIDEIEEYSALFIERMETYLDAIFPNRSIEDDFSMLNRMKELFEPYKYVGLIDSIIDWLDQDMDELIENASMKHDFDDDAIIN